MRPRTLPAFGWWTGDTKVVDAGHGDGVFINTAGIGIVADGVNISPTRAQVGDVVIVSGDIGVHRRGRDELSRRSRIRDRSAQ